MKVDKKEELETKLEESLIKNDNDFINKLADLPTNTNKEPRFEILEDKAKEKIEEKQAEILEFIETNSVEANKDKTEEERTKLFMSCIEMWDEFKSIIKNTKCKINFTNIELKVIDKKLHQNVEYTNETIFYGIHLKKHLLDTITKSKGGDYSNTPVSISFSHAVALYHIISDLTVKGLNKETFAFGHVLYNLSEITEVYNYFDRVSSYTSKVIQEWNMGLSQPEETEEDNEDGTPKMKVEK